MPRSWLHPRGTCRGSDQFDNDVDIVPCCFGIRACLVPGVHQGLGDFALQTWKADVEASLKEEIPADSAQVHFGVNGGLSRVHIVEIGDLGPEAVNRSVYDP